MDRNDRNIEDLFRTLFEQFAVIPTPGLWNKIQAKISWKQFLSFGLNSFNVFYLALIIALAGAGTYLLLSRPIPQGITENSEIIPSSQAIQPEPTHDQVISRQGKIAAVKKTPGPIEPASVKKTGTEPASRAASRQDVSNDKT